MKKEIHITYILAIIIVALASYFMGANHIYMAKDVRTDGTESIWYPHYYNKAEALYHERILANALFEGLHRFYASDDNNFWFDSFVQTKEYQTIDSILGGDWEDFYYYETPMLQDWFSTYSTTEEPSEAFKDSCEYGLIKAVALCRH